MEECGWSNSGSVQEVAGEGGAQDGGEGEAAAQDRLRDGELGVAGRRRTGQAGRRQRGLLRVAAGELDHAVVVSQRL